MNNNWIEKRIADLKNADAEYDKMAQMEWKNPEIMTYCLWEQSQSEWYDRLGEEMSFATDHKDFDQIQRLMEVIFLYDIVMDKDGDYLSFYVDGNEILGTKFQYTDGKMKCIQRYSDDEEDENLYDCDIEVPITEENLNTIDWLNEIYYHTIENDLYEIDNKRGY